MAANVQALPIAFGPAYIRPAEIIHAGPDHIYRVRLAGRGPVEEMTVRPAMALTGTLGIGDKVLIAGEGSVSGYIIGTLDPEQPAAIRTADGAGARISGQGQDQAIAVHDHRGQTVFEYYPGSGRSVVSAPKGDLQLRAPDGNIELHAGKGISCSGAEAVSISGTQGIRLCAKGRGLPDQSLRMDSDGAHLGVHAIDVAAGQGRFSIARASYHGKQVASSVDRARMTYNRLEIRAQRILQRSEHLFHQVRQLCQVQAGRLRTLVHGAHHIQSERTTLIAKEDVHIDGKKINLG